MLLERGADPNADVESSGNCMHIVGRNTEMLKLLASYGGEYAEYEDLSGVSPSALKAVYGDDLPLRYYVDRADIETLTSRLNTAPELVGEVLKLAVRKFHAPSKMVVRYCLDRDSSAAKQVRANELIYMLHRLRPAEEKSMVEMIGWLLEGGMNPNDADWLRVTSLHRLAIGSQAHGSDGMVYRPHIDVMRMFIDAGAELDAKDEEFHSTPLGWAARWGRKDMVALLLERGAKTNLPDDLPWATPLACARHKGHGKVEQMLTAAGATSDGFSDQRGDLENRAVGGRPPSSREKSP